jgi:hypothetical protein
MKSLHCFIPISFPDNPLPKTERTHTRWALKEIRRRRRLLAEFDLLRAQGQTIAAAARQIRQPYSTLWRWQRRLEPHNHHSGVKSTFSKFKISPALTGRVQRLQLAGFGAARAWRAAANDQFCPRPLTVFLRQAKNIPPSFIRHARLKRIQTTIFQGVNFLFVAKMKFQ